MQRGLCTWHRLHVDGFATAHGRNAPVFTHRAALEPPDPPPTFAACTPATGNGPDSS